MTTKESSSEVPSEVPSFCQPYKPASLRPRLLFAADDPNATSISPPVLPTEHLKIIEENLKGKDEEEEKDEEAKPHPDPQETITKLLTARGELDVAIDLINNLESSKYLDYKITSVISGASAFQEAAIEGVWELGKRQRQMIECARRLREGSSALRMLAEKDNRYLSEIGSLQRYWRVRVNPLLAEFAEAPFSVDLDLWSEASSSSSASIPSASSSSPLCGVKTLFPVLRDPISGKARMEIDHEDGELLVAEGWESIHELLRVEQVNFFWRTALNSVEEEVRALPAEERCVASDLLNRVLLAPSEGLSIEATRARSTLLGLLLRKKESSCPFTILGHLRQIDS